MHLTAIITTDLSQTRFTTHVLESPAELCRKIMIHTLPAELCTKIMLYTLHMSESVVTISCDLDLKSMNSGAQLANLHQLST